MPKCPSLQNNLANTQLLLDLGCAQEESLFTLADGVLGVRGGAEELGGVGGVFMTGVYDRTPIAYHERLSGFAQTSEVSSLDIVSLTKQSIKTSASGSYSLNNPTTGYYLWLCVPSSMSIQKVTSSGFDVPMEAAANGSTAVDSYKC